MILLRSFLVCLFVVLWFANFSQQEDQTIYIKGVRCNSSVKYVHQNVSCYPKSYNRSFSTMNVVAKFKVPLTKFFVSI